MKANQNFSRKLDSCLKSDPTHLSSNSAKTKLENTITVETQLDVSKVISEIMTIKIRQTKISQSHRYFTEHLTCKIKSHNDNTPKSKKT
jgi:hypothetical protein